MLTLLLTRADETPDSTLSVLWTLDPHDDSIRDTFLGFVIEDGPRPVKVPGVTRIPSGIYKLAKRTHGKFYERYKSMYAHEWVPELVGVPGYGDILIHAGNEVSDTRGCLLINGTATFNGITGTYAGQQSVVAYKRLYEYLKARWSPDGIQIEIRR